jgi:hypothetical protein
VVRDKASRRAVFFAQEGISDKIKSACQMTEEEVIALRDTLHSFAHPAQN